MYSFQMGVITNRLGGGILTVLVMTSR